MRNKVVRDLVINSLTKLSITFILIFVLFHGVTLIAIKSLNPKREVLTLIIGFIEVIGACIGMIFFTRYLDRQIRRFFEDKI